MIIDMMKMKWEEVLFWFDIYDYQVTEEEIVEGLRYDSKGNKKTLPPPQKIRQLTEKRRKERKNGKK